MEEGEFDGVCLGYDAHCYRAERRQRGGVPRTRSRRVTPELLLCRVRAQSDPHLNTSKLQIEPQFVYDRDGDIISFFASLSRARSEPETLRQGSSFRSFHGFSTASDIHAGISHQNLGDAQLFVAGDISSQILWEGRITHLKNRRHISDLCSQRLPGVDL